MNDNSDKDLMIKNEKRGNYNRHLRSRAMIMQAPRISAMEDQSCQRDRPGWVDQSMQQKDAIQFRRVICHQFYATE